MIFTDRLGAGVSALPVLRQEFKLELKADGTQATTADFQNWWDSNTALKALVRGIR